MGTHKAMQQINPCMTVLLLTARAPSCLHSLYPSHISITPEPHWVHVQSVMGASLISCISCVHFIQSGSVSATELQRDISGLPPVFLNIKVSHVLSLNARTLKLCIFRSCNNNNKPLVKTNEWSQTTGMILL